MREKKPHQYKEDVINEVERLKLTFEPFADGVRVLFLIHRNKEGGDTNNTKVEKIVTTDRREYWEAVAKLIEQKNAAPVPYRVYASVNCRHIDKAIRQFKFEQLEADYYDRDQRHGFYYDIRNRWIGCLMQPPQKASSYFLFDVDAPDNGPTLKALAGSSKAEIVASYRTKNGWHIVTEPFNHTTIQLPPETSLNTDGLVLLSF